MILLLIDTIESAYNQVQMGFTLAQRLNKKIGVLSYVETQEGIEHKQSLFLQSLEQMNFGNVEVFLRASDRFDLLNDCERLDAAFLLVQWDGKAKKRLKTLLKYCRGLRIPYLFCKPDFVPKDYAKVMVPVGFLVEEYEKTQFATAFGRFFNAKITLLLANDYGTKARTTANKMQSVFDKFQLVHRLEKARSDSFKLDQEAIKKAMKENFDIVLISASREYGPDDLIFGPKEYRLIKKSNVPLLLINPRGDLYALCD